MLDLPVKAECVPECAAKRVNSPSWQPDPEKQGLASNFRAHSLLRTGLSAARKFAASFFRYCYFHHRLPAQWLVPAPHMQL